MVSAGEPFVRLSSGVSGFSVMHKRVEPPVSDPVEVSLAYYDRCEYEDEA